MKFLNSRYTLAILCIAAIVAALYGRLWIYPQPTKPERVNQAAGIAPREQEGPIIVHYHERRPYYYFEDDYEIIGLCVDPVNLIFTQAGIDMVWQQTPAKRQLELIKANTKCECAAGWFKTDARQKYGLYTLPIYQDSSTIALAREDEELIVSGQALHVTMKNRQLRLLRKDGYSYGQFIDGHIASCNPRQVITRVGNMSMLKMVYTHRADYFFITVQEAEDLISHSGLPAGKFKLIRFSDMPEGNKRYLICSQKVGDAVIAQLNQAIRRYLK